MKKNIPLYISILVPASIAVFILGLTFGSVDMSSSQLLAAVNGTDENAHVILFDLRLPRVLAAGFAGVGLATAGLLLQTVTGNDLCAPNIIGINAGAGCAVMLFLCFAPMHYRAMPVAAFAGAIITVLVVLGIAFAGSGLFEKSTLVLAGVAVSALLNAFISFLSLKFPEVLSTYSAFSIGGFLGIEFAALQVPILIIIFCIAISLLLSGKLKILLLGDDVASSLGVNVGLLRFVAVALASALCAAVVSYAGLLGFIGLAVPHISRRLCGQDIWYNICCTSLLGWILVISADLVGRTVFAPTEIPAGTITAILGCPFFLYLLLRKRGK